MSEHKAVPDSRGFCRTCGRAVMVDENSRPTTSTELLDWKHAYPEKPENISHRLSGEKVSEDRTNRVALILRTQGTTYAEIASLLNITEEEAKQAVVEGVREAQIEQPSLDTTDQGKMPMVTKLIADALWLMAANFQNLGDLGFPGYSRKITTLNNIREQLETGELEIRKAVK